MADEQEAVALRGGNALLIVGMAAVVVGLGASAEAATRLLPGGAESAGSASVGRAIVVLTETLACLAFACVTAFALTIRDRMNLVWTARIAASTKVLWLLASVSANWTWGWSTLLDTGFRPWPVWLAILSVGQALLWINAAMTPERHTAAARR